MVFFSAFYPESKEVEIINSFGKNWISIPFSAFKVHKYEKSWYSSIVERLGNVSLNINGEKTFGSVYKLMGTYTFRHKKIHNYVGFIKSQEATYQLNTI